MKLTSHGPKHGASSRSRENDAVEDAFNIQAVATLTAAHTIWSGWQFMVRDGWPVRPIELIYRSSWVSTKAQELLPNLLCDDATRYSLI